VFHVLPCLQAQSQIILPWERSLISFNPSSYGCRPIGKSPSTKMANEKYFEMTVAEGSDPSTDSKAPHTEQGDEIIFHQTESHSSAKGLIEVREPQSSGIRHWFAIDYRVLGVHPTPCHYQLWLHSASSMGSFGPLYPVQPAQWRPSIVALWQSAGWLWILPYCIVTGRNGIHVSQHWIRSRISRCSYANLCQWPGRRCSIPLVRAIRSNMATFLGLVPRLDDRLRLGYSYGCLACLSRPGRPSSHSTQQPRLCPSFMAYHTTDVRFCHPSSRGQPVV